MAVAGPNGNTCLATCLPGPLCPATSQHRTRPAGSDLFWCCNYSQNITTLFLLNFIMRLFLQVCSHKNIIRGGVALYFLQRIKDKLIL